MAANYGRPKPIDSLRQLAGCWLRVHCACGHRISRQVQAFAIEHHLAPDLQAYQVIDRLRCSRCGAKGARADVSERRAG